MRARGLRQRTQEAYLAWMRRFLAAGDAVGEAQVARFLSGLNSSPATRDQALRALVFLCRDVAGIPTSFVNDVFADRSAPRPPVVLTREEIAATLARMNEPARLMATLLYGAGLRLLECCALGVQNVDFQNSCLLGRAPLPISTREALASQLEAARRLRESDSRNGVAAWSWVFPSDNVYVDRATRQRRRHHLHETVLQKAFAQARLAAGIEKPASCRTLRHSFAAHLLEAGCPPDRVREMLGHADLRGVRRLDAHLCRSPRGLSATGPQPFPCENRWNDIHF